MLQLHWKISPHALPDLYLFINNFYLNDGFKGGGKMGSLPHFQEYMKGFSLIFTRKDYVAMSNEENCGPKFFAVNFLSCTWFLPVNYPSVLCIFFHQWSDFCRNYVIDLVQTSLNTPELPWARCSVNKVMFTQILHMPYTHPHLVCSSKKIPFRSDLFPSVPHREQGSLLTSKLTTESFKKSKLWSHFYIPKWKLTGQTCGTTI